MRNCLVDGKALPLYIRKVKCPRNYVLIPGKEPFLLEPDPKFKFLSDADAKRFKIRKYRAKRDRFGRKIQDFRSYFQEEISAGMALENIYNPQHPDCIKCKRCLEGTGGITDKALRRINA